MIQLIGDIALTGLYVDDPQNNAKRIEKILPFFDNDSLKFANLETPVGIPNSQNPHKNKIHTTSREALKEILVPLGIQVVSLANNHVFDCLKPGLVATIETLKELGIQSTGAGYLPEHIEPIFCEKNGKNIVFMAYVDLSTNPKTETFKDLYINYFDLETVLNDIQKVKERADTIICSIHWGEDYSFFPTPIQQIYARKLIDSGATIIMGHHPHTIQPYESYKDGFIFYSLGGLTFGDYRKKGSQYGALYKKTKTGLIANFNEGGQVTFSTSFEKIQNYLVPSSLIFENWSVRINKINQIARKYKLVHQLIKFQEKVLYRVYEYFFGYYQKPLKRLFQWQNLKKIKKLFR